MKYKITAEVDCEVSNVLKPWSLCSGFPARKITLWSSCKCREQAVYGREREGHNGLKKRRDKNLTSYLSLT